jgi:hypothetical protein
MDAKTAERFFSRVDTEGPGGCWLWTGYTMINGYGIFYVVKKRSLAHRVAYEHLVGVIPEGLDIDHLCRVRNCINPDHLEPVTRQENLLRGIGPSLARARKGTKTHCVNGHEYTPQNTYIKPSNGLRHCRTCGREQNRARRAAQSTAA